jgi:hypothetical protein
MKKIIVQIKDLAWYEANKNEKGIVYLDPAVDNDFFSRGMEIYCGKITEVTNIDTSGNMKLKIDGGEWLWKNWMFSIMEEKEVSDDNIIDVTFKEDHEIISEDKEIHEAIMLEDFSERNTLEFKMKLINDVNKWNLPFNIGTCLVNILTSNKNNIQSYKNSIEIAIICLQNELKELEKEK